MMVGLKEVYLKELAEHLNSSRLIIMGALVYIIGFSMSFMSISTIKLEFISSRGENLFLKLFTTQSGGVPSFLGFLSFFGPLISLILVFDSINGEDNQGTLGLVMSQPIHRDSLINGKFLAATTNIAILLVGVFGIIIGLGVASIGAYPSVEETIRLGIFGGICVVYLAFWVSLGLLFSIVFKREGTSALASIVSWLFLTIFIYMMGDMVQSTGLNPQGVLYLSPSYLFTQSSSIIMIPLMRIVGPVSYEQVVGMVANPLSLTQSLSVIWPHLTALTAAMMLIFVVSYVLFVRREIRST
jgi:ABC-2 type transport system permease protein